MTIHETDPVHRTMSGPS